ncbi:hypothetical protein Q0F98_29955 [Paenibacillus amylolyticus]|nr:hypothetical protein Q0F98_29955 [Paenibacillus amylolyticus]
MYDMMGGGVISTHIKRGRMDDAQVAIMDAGSVYDVFRRNWRM